jgi:hypothetical protein
MKKLLGFSPITYLMIAVSGFALSVGGMWHQHLGQKQLNEFGVLNEGISTCFNRVSQTFTATMIKDFKSNYLTRSFMALSDECLSEAIKGMKPFKSELNKGHKTLQQLISEVHWFHESVLKTITPAMAKVDKPFDTASAVSRFKKMEEFKTTLSDEIQTGSNELRQNIKNDQVAVTLGILAVFMALVVMMAQENQKNALRRQIEARAHSLLEGSKFENSAVIDQLIDEALLNASLENTAQLFRDYNGEILEKQTTRFSATSSHHKEEKIDREEEQEYEEASEGSFSSSSLRETLITLQNIHGKENINSSEVRDVRLAIEAEALEQVINAAITKLLEHKNGNKRVQVSNQVHSDRSILNFFLKDSTFNVSELEFSSTANAQTTDLNLILLKEICADNGVQWFAENKLSRNGSIEGMNIRMVVKRAPKNAKKNLVSVVRGKKRDIQSSIRSELVN